MSFVTSGWRGTLRVVALLAGFVTISSTMTTLGATAAPPTAAPPSALSGGIRAPHETLAHWAGKSGDTTPLWVESTGISRRAWASALTDRSVRVDDAGRAFVVDAAPRTDSLVAPPTAASIASTSTIPLSSAFTLHSNPGSTHTIYLDFTGFDTSATAWYLDSSWGVTPATAVFGAYDLDGSPSTFNDTERRNIIDAWADIAEDYAPFDVDVTTAEPGAGALTQSSPSDATYGARAVITTATNPIESSCNCGGIAYLRSFGDPDAIYSTALAFPLATDNGKIISDIVSHEIGHTVGLSHDGTTNSGYYSGAYGWAPIMGVGYVRPLVQFSKGDYVGANNHENDYAVMQSYGLPLRRDDVGGTPATSSPLVVDVPTTAVISTPSDVDLFTFVATGSQASIAVTNSSPSGNIDVQLTVTDSSGTVLSVANPAFSFSGMQSDSGLDASVTVPTVVGQRYFVAVDGVGYGSVYTDYGSTGEYSIALSAPPAPFTAGIPTISGSGIYGTTLTGLDGTWDPAARLTTTWYRIGIPTGVTGNTYTILPTDVGSTFTFGVVGSLFGNPDASAMSAGVLIRAATISPTGTPIITGSTKVKSVLTVIPGGWMSGTQFGYQWLRNGNPISGATSTTYTLQSRDLHSRIAVRVTASASGYSTVVANSMTTAVIAKATKRSR